MTTCKNCGKPLVLNGGKCAYCGATPKTENTRLGSTSKKLFDKFSFFSKGIRVQTITALTRKILISTIIALLLAITMLCVELSPGFIISIAMLLYAIVTGLFGLFIRTEIIEELRNDLGENKLVEKLNLFLNLILALEYFFFAAGVVCYIVTYEWWPILITEIVGIISLLIMVVFGFSMVDD